MSGSKTQTKVVGVDAGQLPGILMRINYDRETEDSVLCLVFDLFYWHPETSHGEGLEYLAREGLLDQVGDPYSDGLLDELVRCVKSICLNDLNGNARALSDTDKVLEYDNIRNGCIWFRY